MRNTLLIVVVNFDAGVIYMWRNISDHVLRVSVEDGHLMRLFSGDPLHIRQMRSDPRLTLDLSGQTHL